MPSRGSSSGPFGVDPTSSKELAKFTRDLRKFAPEVAKETRKRFKSAASPVLSDIHKRQPKNSGELRHKTKISVARGSTAIRSSARHARISEFGGRHPLWGRDQWVTQPAAPAIFPAVDAGRSKFIEAAKKAVDQGAKEAGFK